jgi:hypothetical protein
LAAILNAEMLVRSSTPEFEFRAYKNRSSGVTAIEMPPPPSPPVGKGEPGTGRRRPVERLIRKTLISLLRALEIKRKFRARVTVAREGANPPGRPAPPVGKGEPGTGVREPLGLTLNPETRLTRSEVPPRSLLA